MMTEAMDHESSPGLELIKPDFGPRKATPPPFANQGQSPESDAKYANKDFFRSNRQVNLRVGEEAAHDALIRHTIGANNPGIWRLERETPSLDPSPIDQSFNSGGPDAVGTINFPKTLPESKPVQHEIKPDLKNLAEEALDLNSSSPEAEPLQPPALQPPKEERVVLPPLSELVNGPPESIPPPRPDRSPSSIAKAQYNSLPALLRNPSAAQSPEDSVLRLPPIQTKLNELGPVLPPPNGPSPRLLGACEPGVFTPSSQGSTAAPSGTFKCSHPGCTAPPFQTQYLLNSHANVHSQDRPHFCPIEGCSRGPGGKGFKRKNEMIRHGLVHNSPGYVCPFCPDQQHKYPRPDNLQRHVRVHHVDKNKDDPALRHVLAQRPEGSGRGRRRRMNPQ
ncbi:hypothetical protein BDW74DRAFT_125556 [Aspergillus multicolor]|uniref:uncharacterized protein n=1 Tax=Aspergillus multicolor TaxID=41759 RepID=UPI003CCD9995